MRQPYAREIEGIAIYATRKGPHDEGGGKLGGILCVGDVPAGVTWDALLEKGGGGGGDDDDGGGGGASVKFRVMPPDVR